uniref:C2 domain-containing protein n=1 Tax=Amazona collaria TaxID=241587 RepID=A0A8B9G5G8_9PSIT
LCNGDPDRTIKVEVYDWDRTGSHDFIGEFTTSYCELARGQHGLNVYEVVNPKKKLKKKKYLNSGTVTLLSFSVESDPSFLDYIRGGTQLNFTVAIDFTASNGNPSQPTSLHYLSPFQLNAYTMAALGCHGEPGADGPMGCSSWPRRGAPIVVLGAGCPLWHLLWDAH